MNEDTINLLEECNSGIKMAVISLDEVLPLAKSEKLKQKLIYCKNEHEKLGNDTHSILNQYNKNEKDPNPIAKSMSWLKTNVKLAVNPGDDTVADLITEGCSMGVKSLNKYLNQYKAADLQAKYIAEKLIHLEEQLAVDIKTYL